MKSMGLSPSKFVSPWRLSGWQCQGEGGGGESLFNRVGLLSLEPRAAVTGTGNVRGTGGQLDMFICVASVRDNLRSQWGPNFLNLGLNSRFEDQLRVRVDTELKKVERS